MNQVTVVPYDPVFREAFKTLNLAWIERDYVPEPSDFQQLDDPETSLLKGGGQIFFVLENGRPVGTCGLVSTGAGVFELVKMAVATDKQGLGYSKLLAEAALLWAWQQGGRQVTLESNARQTAALGLYRRLGFEHVPPHPSPYSRADVFMALDLAQWAAAHNSR